MRTFVAVVEVGSFTDAANLVGRSQSTVSTQINKLEETLGTRLVKRGKRTTTTTYAGEELLIFARDLLNLEEKAVNSVKKPCVAGTIRLGTQDDFAARRLPGILSRFKEINPEVQVEVLCDLACYLHRQLEKDALDLLLLRQPEASEAEELLWKERLVWIGPPGTQVNKRNAISLVAFPEPCFYRKIIDNALDEQGLKSKVTYTSSSSASVQEAVRAGLGVSVFAEGTVLEDVHILPRDSGLPELPETCVVLHRAPKKHSLATERLAEYLIDNLRPRTPKPHSATGSHLRSHKLPPTVSIPDVKIEEASAHIEL